MILILWIYANPLRGSTLFIFLFDYEHTYALETPIVGHQCHITCRLTCLGKISGSDQQLNNYHAGKTIEKAEIRGSRSSKTM